MFPFLKLTTFLNTKKNARKRKKGLHRGPYRMFFIDHGNKLVYVENPKAASRSILESMGTAHIAGIHVACSVPKPHLAIALPCYKSWIPHIFVFSKWRLSHETRDYVTKHETEHYTFFTFVRNPFDRLVSGYTNKIISNTPIKPPARANVSTWHEFLELTDNEDPHSPRVFARFVKKYIATYSTNELDVHFKPQHILTEDNVNRPLDFVGHLEHFDEDWQYLAQRFSLPQRTVTHANQTTHRNTYETYFDNIETIELVYRIYKEDIERYGYTEAYATLTSAHVR